MKKQKKEENYLAYVFVVRIWFTVSYLQAVIESIPVLNTESNRTIIDLYIFLHTLCPW